MSIIQKSGKYYYKINEKNGKKTRISEKEYYKVSGINTKNTKTILKKTKKSVKKRKNQYMIGGAISDFLLNLKSNNNLVEIGRGGFGIVYLDKTQPNSVFKISTKENTCRTWVLESDIYKNLAMFDIDSKLCKIIKMKDYVSNNQMCAMELTRAYNPLGLDIYYTIQPQFQYTSFNHHYSTRGLFLGINELIENNIFTKENIPNYIAELGIIMAKLHYKVKNDGYDIELFISKINKEETIIYIGDFDLSKFYDDEPDIERLVWSLEAVPYFPIEGDLYKIFSNNYIQEATKYKMAEVAKKVLSEYSTV